MERWGLGIFRVAAFAEAASWAGLLIGMFFKYVVVHNEIGVQIFGAVHGAMFVLYAMVTLFVGISLNWKPKTTLLGVLASIPPLATIWFERAIARRAPAATSQIA